MLLPLLLNLPAGPAGSGFTPSAPPTGFILDRDTLGGLLAAVTKTICEDRGLGLELTWTQNGFDQDLELYGYSVEFFPAEQTAFDTASIITSVFSSGTFVLDVGTLGGLTAFSNKTTCEDVGQALTLTWTQSGFDQDLETFGYSVELAPGEQVPYDTQQINTQVITAYGTGIYGLGPYSGVLGNNTGVFILDISTLGSLFVGENDIPIEGRGRSIEVTWSQTGFDQDFEMFGYGIRFAPAETYMAPDTV